MTIDAIATAIVAVDDEPHARALIVALVLALDTLDPSLEFRRGLVHHSVRLISDDHNRKAATHV